MIKEYFHPELHHFRHAFWTPIGPDQQRVNIMASDPEFVRYVNPSYPQATYRWTGEYQTLLLNHRQTVSAEYYRDIKVLSLGGSTDQLAHRIPYVLYYLSEVIRQERGMYTLHAAAVSREGKAVLILGDKTSGKTLLSYELCSKYGFKLIGNDILTVGWDQTGDIAVYSGDGEFKFRNTPSLPEKIMALAPRSPGITPNHDKITVKPAEIGIEIDTGPIKITNVEQVMVTAGDDEKLEIGSASPNDLFRLHENLYRYISGATTPLYTPEGHLLGSLPSLDDPTLSRTRARFANQLLESLENIYGPLIQIGRYVSDKVGLHV